MPEKSWKYYYQPSWHCNIDRFLNKRTLSLFLLWFLSIFFTNIKYGIKLNMRDLLSDVVLNKPPLNYKNTYVILVTGCLVLEWFDFTYYLQPNLLFFYVLFNQEERETLEDRKKVSGSWLKNDSKLSQIAVLFITKA